MNAEVNMPLPVPPQHALAASIGYLILEARREGFPLIAHLLEVALYAIENHSESGRASRYDTSTMST
jgi:hypothetical protein